MTTQINIKNGGPAFSAEIEWQNNYSPGVEKHQGMTLRDYFAGQALNAIAATLKDGIRPDCLHFLALDAYGIADAMINAREVKP